MPLLRYLNVDERRRLAGAAGLLHSRLPVHNELDGDLSLTVKDISRHHRNESVPLNTNSEKQNNTQLCD